MWDSTTILGQMRPQDQHIWVEFNGPNGAIVFYPNLSANHS
eukprot:COSAG01_NODE_57346_length_312_cov_38.877934_1_plen_40_part_10